MFLAECALQAPFAPLNACPKSSKMFMRMAHVKHPWSIRACSQACAQRDLLTHAMSFGELAVHQLVAAALEGRAARESVGVAGI